MRPPMKILCAWRKPKARRSRDGGLLTPTEPSTIVALWNNFNALATKLQHPEPPEPLYLGCSGALKAIGL